ncbi:galactose mutarotase [Duganella sp. LX20W]|uniref:Aldose 1-epimerase n=1 Tax=Rugamonas brunnea TaxID=2758569 RepID=A0A7W2EN82_9BURK|nr:aldose epimerase family protein [Rugamonas brunnea]MBA5635560.1 galactose mutarotase [Rugamonas brunnea]
MNATPLPSITRAPFGQLPDGRAAHLYTLDNGCGLTVCISDFGGIITAIHAPDRDGVRANVTLGHPDLASYLNDRGYLGALIGRHANRIGRGRYTNDGQPVQLDVNDGENHLHGGRHGLHTVLWQAAPSAKTSAARLSLTHLSPDGDQGYPGNLALTVLYELNRANELLIHFRAECDRATPVSLTSHAYFNLAGQGDILDQRLTIAADHYTPVDAGLIPTGAIVPVEGTPFDFRAPRAIGQHIGADHPQLLLGRGYDHNFVLRPRPHAGPTLAARLHDPASGRVLELSCTAPGLQFYSGNFLTGGAGQHAYRSGLCLEPQQFPDNPNQPAFPSAMLRPGQVHRSTIAYRFLVAD